MSCFDNFNPIVSINNEIIRALIENNMDKLKKYLNKRNINTIIGSTHMTALHYALSICNDNDDIIKLLLDNGADPYLKQHTNLDCFDIALNNKKKYFFDYFENQQKMNNSLHKRKRDEYEQDYNDLKEKYNELRDNNFQLKKECDNIKKECDNIKKECDNIKKYNIELEKDNIELEKNNKELKNNYENLEYKHYELIKDHSELELSFENLQKKSKK